MLLRIQIDTFGGGRVDMAMCTKVFKNYIPLDPTILLQGRYPNKINSQTYIYRVFHCCGVYV